MKISVVAPFYNEAENVDDFFGRVLPVIQSQSSDYEILCINDGSTDNTLPELQAWKAKCQQIKIVNLSRNFGKESALTAGLGLADGDVVIPLDSDLQDPPELIAEMLSKWKEGYDVVYAKRVMRQSDTVFKRWSALGFYRLFNWITDTKIPYNTGDFRLLDRKAVEAVRRLDERTRFMKGIFAWVGFRQTAVEYERPPREHGKVHLHFSNLWRLAVDGITSFSTFPLRVWSYIGLFIALISFIYGVVIIAKTLLFGVDLPGYASIITVVLFLGGIQLISLGVIGEYIGRIFYEIKGRPNYILDEDRREVRRDDEEEPGG
ncbi:MAG: glycosyltransferase family 2 protein [Candidatus Sedimenticola sp. (ex Thyasira tokunagai)]